VLTDRLAIDGGTPVRERFPRLGKGIDLVGDEEIEAVVAVLRDRALFRYHGPRTPSRDPAFEAAACEAFGCAYALATSSGTAALRCALAALGVGCGDEVVVPAFTFIATVGAVVNAGAVPVFAEVDDSLTLDPNDLENVACALEELRAVAAEHGVPVLEDAAQAIGATYRGRSVGTIGELGACSFQETKNIVTGEGGLVCTDNEELYVRAARFHDQGGQFVTQYRGERGPEGGDAFAGENLRMTEIAGAIGTVQLGRLPGLLAAMRINATRVAERVGTIDGLTPRRLPDPAGAGGSSLTWFAPGAATAQRMVDALRAEGVPAAQMYEGRPVYLSPALAAPRPARVVRGTAPNTRPTPRTGPACARAPRTWPRARSPSASVPRSPSRTAPTSRRACARSLATCSARRRGVSEGAGTDAH
jgi:8-amino-3,8-dideoxy-alpha-D-manno-octulosonate transaminase